MDYIISVVKLDLHNLGFEKFQKAHTIGESDHPSYHLQRLRDTRAFKNISLRLTPIEDYVIFNCRGLDNVSIMFFNDVMAAYSDFPNYDTYSDLKRKKIKIAVFNNGKLPSYLMADKEVIKLPGY